MKSEVLKLIDIGTSGNYSKKYIVLYTLYVEWLLNVSNLLLSLSIS